MTQSNAGTTPTMQDLLEYWYTDLTLQEIADKFEITLGRLYALRDKYKLPKRDRVQRNDREEANPSPEEIAAAALEIRRGWTPSQEAARRAFPAAKPWSTPRFVYNSSNGLFSPLN